MIICGVVRMLADATIIIIIIKNIFLFLEHLIFVGSIKCLFGGHNSCNAMKSDVVSSWSLQPSSCCNSARQGIVPCNVCPHDMGSENCRIYQQLHGCHACDRPGCWRLSADCPFIAVFQVRGSSVRTHCLETRCHIFDKST